MPTTLESVLLRAVNASLGIGNEDLSQIFTDDVVGWSPNLSVSSRKELEEAFADRGGAISNVSVDVTSIDVLVGRVIAEWHLAADHTGDLTLDDLTLPATGRHVELAGATFAEFSGDRISSFRHYFDDAALLEQLLLA